MNGCIEGKDVIEIFHGRSSCKQFLSAGENDTWEDNCGCALPGPRVLIIFSIHGIYGATRVYAPGISSLVQFGSPNDVNATRVSNFGLPSLILRSGACGMISGPPESPKEQH